jgi:EF-P beta-lysylation protein EpmB
MRSSPPVDLIIESCSYPGPEPKLEPSPEPKPSILSEGADSCQRQTGARGSGSTARPLWKHELARAYRDPKALLADLDLDPGQFPDLDLGPQPFRLLVPREFAALMTPGDPKDPLLRQILPLGAERSKIPGYGPDPVDDAAARAAPGLLRKYRGRALLIAHGACAVHCRYCFRRHYPHGPQSDAEGGLRARSELALKALAQDPSLTEAILSGGDPLMLEDADLAWLVKRIGAIGQVARLRIHTRLPVVLPSRITRGLCDCIAGSRLQVAVAIHVNHPRELGEGAARALRRLRASGASLLNQSVLLKGVNDEVGILERLSERLFELGVLPYYLHALDPVEGAAHFAVPDEHASLLVAELRERLPGYLVPRLVREVRGKASKTPLP